MGAEFGAGGEFDGPNGEDLRALVDALEAVFGFGHGFDGGDPELAGAGGLEGDGDGLPFVDNAELFAGNGGGPAERVTAAIGFEEAVGRGRREKIEDDLKADIDGRGAGGATAHEDIADDFESVFCGSKRKLLSAGQSAESSEARATRDSATSATP